MGAASSDVSNCSVQILADLYYSPEGGGEFPKCGGSRVNFWIIRQTGMETA